MDDKGESKIKTILLIDISWSLPDLQKIDVEMKTDKKHPFHSVKKIF